MANDMQAMLERFRGAVSGDAPIEHKSDGERGEHDALDAFISLYADDAVMYFQGRDWPYAGRHDGRTAIATMFREGIAMFAAPLEFWENRLWILDEERLLWWWRSRSTTFKGEPMSNSGLTVLRFRDNLIVEHQEYTDTEYLAEKFSGWRDAMPAAKDAIPAWPAVEAGKAFPDADGKHDLDRPWRFD